MNEEEIINEIDFCLAGEYITVEHRQAIEGLLVLYNQEKEKNKKLEEERQHLMDGYLKQAEIKMKIIDMMAEDLQKYTTIRYAEDTKLMNGPYLMTMPEFIKGYYFKKARGESNE